jgi:hypothetical protein
MRDEVETALFDAKCLAAFLEEFAYSRENGSLYEVKEQAWYGMQLTIRLLMNKLEKASKEARQS